MAFITDENGNITLVQGDSGTLVIDGLDTDQNYIIYFAIQDKKRNPIGSELYVNFGRATTSTFYWLKTSTSGATIGVFWIAMGY